MNKEEGKKNIKKEEEIRIDYDNIDVADIMNQIKKKIANRPKKTQEEFRKEEFRYTPSPYTPGGPEEGAEPKKGVRGLLLRIMRPFSPLIKLLILPVYEELRETVLILDRTNKRLDSLSENIWRRLDDLDQRLDTAVDELTKAKEYTKLLHSLSHNIVVELSKLKIEEENLKLKTRIMEKDFEFLGNREKALEKHLLK